MRRPRQHSVFDVSLEHGLSEFLLSGEPVGLQKANVHGTATPSLSLLTAGTVPPNPSALLDPEAA